MVVVYMALRQRPKSGIPSRVGALEYHIAAGGCTIVQAPSLLCGAARIVVVSSGRSHDLVRRPVTRGRSAFGVGRGYRQESLDDNRTWISPETLLMTRGA